MMTAARYLMKVPPFNKYGLNVCMLFGMILWFSTHVHQYWNTCQANYTDFEVPQQHNNVLPTLDQCNFILAQCLQGFRTNIILLIGPVSMGQQIPTIECLCWANICTLINSTLPTFCLHWILICWWRWQPLASVGPMCVCCLGWC